MEKKLSITAFLWFEEELICAVRGRRQTNIFHQGMQHAASQLFWRDKPKNYLQFN